MNNSSSFFISYVNEEKIMSTLEHNQEYALILLATILVLATIFIVRIWITHARLNRRGLHFFEDMHEIKELSNF